MSKIKKIKYGVIPAAGAGTRMGYLGKLLPKCLFSLYDRPILHYVIDQMEGVGIEKIYVIVNFQKERIFEYIQSVKDSIKPEIFFLEQKELRGIGDAVLITKDYIVEPFMTILGDDCTIVDSLNSFVDSFFSKKAIALEGMVEEEDKDILKDTCCAKLDNEGRIIDILEKPENPPYNLRGCGVYVFDPQIFEQIKKTPLDEVKKTLEITHTINQLAQEGLAFGHIFNGDNININSFDDLIKAILLARKLRP